MVIQYHVNINKLANKNYKLQAMHDSLYELLSLY